MTEFEKILEQCLVDLEGGISNVAECLSRYPGYALQLEPVLLTHTALEGVGAAQPSAAFKARVRAKLTQQMHAHPRRRSSRINFGFMRLATNLAIVFLALLSAGIAYAQSALPGDSFYKWKLASENAWRVVSSDPIATDLKIAERRMNELIAVRGDSVLHAEALDAYLEVTARLRSETNAEKEALILQTLDSQAETLNESGILVPGITEEDLPHPLDEILPTLVAPATTLLPEIQIPQPSPTPQTPAERTPVASEVPQTNPTTWPDIFPTGQALPSIIPTIQVPDIVPTTQIPPLLP